MVCSTRAVCVSKMETLECESIVTGTRTDLMATPHISFIKEFQKSTSETTVVVSWTVPSKKTSSVIFDLFNCTSFQANQASEDGFGTTVIEGQQYFALNSMENINSSK